MAGLGVRLYTDEMIHKTLAVALRRLGYDAASCHEAGLGNREISDDDQSDYAAQSGRAILTFSRGDFLRLDAARKAAGRVHHGVIVADPVNDLGELLRRVTRHLDTHPPEVQHDTVLWLSSAPGS